MTKPITMSGWRPTPFHRNDLAGRARELGNARVGNRTVIARNADHTPAFPAAFC